VMLISLRRSKGARPQKFSNFHCFLFKCCVIIIDGIVSDFRVFQFNVMSGMMRWE
jgi:hypothetical protein